MDDIKSEQTAIQEILGDMNLKVNVVCMVMDFVSSSFCYYLISQQLKYLQGDVFINGLVSSCSELMAYLLSGALVNRIGLKNSLVMSYILALGGMIALIFYTGES